MQKIGQYTKAVGNNHCSHSKSSNLHMHSNNEFKPLIDFNVTNFSPEEKTAGTPK